MVKNNVVSKWAGCITETLLQKAIEAELPHPEVLITINGNYDEVKILFRIRKVSREDVNDWYFLNINHILTANMLLRSEGIDKLVNYLVASMVQEIKHMLEEEIKKDQRYDLL